MSESKGTQPGSDVRAVRRMVDDLRAEPTPDLPWAAIEERLLARIDQRALAESRRAPALRAVSPIGRAFSFAAAAAVLALGIASTGGAGRMPRTAIVRHRIEAANIATLANSGGAHDLAALRVGDLIEAREAPVTFGEAGLVRWTLAAGSALRVKTVGLGHTVELERGALRAEVTPRDASEGMVEAFAVEVDGTRVAVHGTAFSVRREDTRVVVDVEHGAVAVGPKGNVGTTTGHLLVGPSRGSFSLDGGGAASLLDRSAPNGMPGPFVVAATAAEPVAANAGAAGTPSPGEPPRLAPEPVAAPVQAPVVAGDVRPGTPVVVSSSKPAVTGEPAAEAPRLTADVVRGRVERCFRAAFEQHSSVLESVSSTLTIEVNPDGTVRAARFDPPLNAELTACAGSAIGGRFAADAGRLAIPVTAHR